MVKRQLVRKRVAAVLVLAVFATLIGTIIVINSGDSTGEAISLGQPSSGQGQVCPIVPEVIGIIFDNGRSELWNTLNNQYKLLVERIYVQNGVEKADLLVNGNRLAGLTVDSSETVFGGPALSASPGKISLHFMSRDYQNPAQSYLVFKIKER